MIRTQNMVPAVYPDYSRDYQALLRLYDYTLNSVQFDARNLDYLLTL